MTHEQEFGVVGQHEFSLGSRVTVEPSEHFVMMCLSPVYVQWIGGVCLAHQHHQHSFPVRASHLCIDGRENN